MRTKRELILCSGTTEYLYAKSLQMELPRSLRGVVSIELANPNTCDSIGLAREAMRKKTQSNRDRNPYSNIWLFYGNQSSDVLSMRKYLSSNGLEAAYCPMCLEQWFILHFEDYAATFTSRDEAIAYLTKIWPQYKKNQINAYVELKALLPIAIGRASSANTKLQPTGTETVPIFTIPKLLTFFDSVKQAS